MREFSNPEAYRRRTQPRPRGDVLAAVEEFFNGVYDLAEKHGIADVTFITNALVHADVDPDDSRSLYTCSHIGNESHSVEMSAYLWGYMRETWEGRLNKLANLASKNASKKGSTGHGNEGK